MNKETPEVDGKTRFRQTTEQIESLIILSHSINVFNSRWVLIRNKLNEILPILAGLPPENQDFGECSSFSGVVEGIDEIASFTIKLAEKCIDCSYSGKLLMQSDLDIICVKLNTFIKSLNELIVYNNSCNENVSGEYAIVISEPGLNASKEDVLFYMNDLFSRFKIGNNEMKKKGLVCFYELIQKNDDFLRIAMEEIEGFGYVLIEFLGLKDFGIQDEVLKSLDIICGFVEYRKGLVGNGLVAPLVRVLESGSFLGKSLCCMCLMKCTAGGENSWAVSAHGGVTSLLRICACEGENGGELVGLACGVLKNVVGVKEIKRFIVEQGGLAIFVNLVNSRNEVCQVSSMEFLQAMVFEDQVVTTSFVDEGGIRVLVHVLDPKSSFSSKTRETSIRVITNLCLDSTRLNSLTSCGFMDDILYYLRNGEVCVQEASLKAAFWLSGISDDFKKAMGEAGFMQEVVKFVGAKSFEVREMAFQTLSNLVSIQKNRKRFVENDENVRLVMQCIDEQEEGSCSSHKKLLLPIIMSLSGCNSGRKKILNSGYLKNIEKLADEQVSDARKIVRNLSSNRIVRVMKGIWH